MGSGCCSGKEQKASTCGNGNNQKGGGGCCSAPEEKPAAPSSGCCAPPQPPPAQTEGCCAGGNTAGQSSCCGEKVSSSTENGGAPPQVEEDCCGGAGDRCCSGNEVGKQSDEIGSIASTKVDSCCGDCGNSCDSPSDVDGHQNDGCQGDEKIPFEEPCTERCDEKCIVAVAAVECEKACSDQGNDDGLGHKHIHDKDGHHPSSACSMHLRSAFDKYSSYLETARCICRSVLDIGLPTTKCTKSYEENPDPGFASASARKNLARSTSTSYHSRQEAGSSMGVANTSVKQRFKKQSSQAEKSGCCSSDGPSGCCSAEKKEPEACDIALPITAALAQVSAPIAKKTREVDVESGGLVEHVTLTVDGMTCSGCASKLERTLKDASIAITGVSSNFVMGTAEFDIDNSIAAVDDLVRSVERATGFKLVRIESGDQALDLVLSGPSSLRALQEASIPGLIQVTPLDKKTARVSYDPTAIGARHLIRRIGHLSSGLAPLRRDPSESSGRSRFWDLLAETVIAAAFTIPVVVLAWGHTPVDHNTRSSISIALATVVQLIGAREFYRPALTALFRTGVLEMDMLIVISISAAYIYSVIAYGFRMAGKPLETAEFFETSTLLITLVLLGRVVAAYARIRAVAAVSIRSLQPTTALLVDEKDGKATEVDARLLQFGDRFKVPPHSKVPTDGRVAEGSSEIDESMITGESLPVVKRPGSDVVAGTINGSGTLLVQLTRLPGKNTVTDIAGMVEDATKSKPKVQDLADRVASYFVPAVGAIAVIVTVVWLAVLLAVRKSPAGVAIADAITYAVAVLAISCPCGIGLAVPMVLVTAGGIAARGGVVIKSADATERALKVTDVVFDKTGTLTESELEVVSEHILVSDAGATKSISAALVRDNSHPVSVAVAKHLAKHNVSSVTGIRTIPGAGVEGKSTTGTVRAGNPEWTNSENHPVVAQILDGKMTVFCVSRGDTLLAVFALKARLRPEAAGVVAQLHSRKITVHLVSGDAAGAVEAVSSAVGIPPDFVYSNCTPAMKRDYVASLCDPAHGRKTVLFCGDGTNDAVAVVQADIGVQISGGSELAAGANASGGGGGGGGGGSGGGCDVTRGAADVVLLSGLQGIPFLLDVSRAAFQRIVFNFVWSAVYNLLAILMTAGAFVTFRIPPAYAGLGELVSVLPVILAAMTMLAVDIRA